jgi:quercetin dioxygenase-like cupin family protein
MNTLSSQNASFQLPFHFKQDRLQSDLKKCREFKFSKNYIAENYDGNNYILPLRSIDGELNRIAALPDNLSRYKNTVALENCEYFQEVISSFECDKESIRLMNLPPGAVINTHTDHKSGYEDGMFRIHVPILTNDQVYFMLEEERLHMKAGEVWYANVNLPHSVQNRGTTDRVHLVIDCIRNDWSDQLFKSMGYDFDLENIEKEEVLSESTIQNIIREIELQNNPAMKQFLIDFKTKHGIN